MENRWKSLKDLGIWNLITGNLDFKKLKIIKLATHSKIIKPKSFNKRENLQKVIKKRNYLFSVKRSHNMRSKLKKIVSKTIKLVKRERDLSMNWVILNLIMLKIIKKRTSLWKIKHCLKMTQWAARFKMAKYNTQEELIMTMKLSKVKDYYKKIRYSSLLIINKVKKTFGVTSYWKRNRRKNFHQKYFSKIYKNQYQFNNKK